MKNWIKITTALIITTTSIFSNPTFATGTETVTGNSAPTAIANNPNITISNTNNLPNGNKVTVGTMVEEGYNQVFIAMYNDNNQVIWQKTGNGGGHYGNKAANVTSDDQGNIYITGNHSGNLDLGKQVNSQGVSNMFVAKYNSQGDLLWITQAEGADYANQVTGETISMENGNIVVTGMANGTVKFGTTQLTGAGQQYKATYDLEGNLIEAKIN
jgi:hypothetical protein